MFFSTKKPTPYIFFALSRIKGIQINLAIHVKYRTPLAIVWFMEIRIRIIFAIFGRDLSFTDQCCAVFYSLTCYEEKVCTYNNIMKDTDCESIQNCEDCLSRLPAFSHETRRVGINFIIFTLTTKFPFSAALISLIYRKTEIE